jgi:S1-C subfamily serine protease
MLRRNVVFVAGWVVAGLAIAFLVNLLWRGDRGPPRTAAPVAAVEQVLVPPTVAAAHVVDAPGVGKAQVEPTPAPVSAEQGPVYSYAPAVRASAPAVVSVYTLSKVTVGTMQGPSPRLQEGLGSGVIVDTQGHIVTNHHVIEGAARILVQLADGHSAEATVVGADPATDLAVLKVDLPAADLQKLPVMSLGRADRVAVGDTVLAIGNPLGLTQTVTHGIISATGRAQLGVATYENFLQTDAAINKGNSGGALVNLRGELIGINTAVIKGGEGLGMAIPVDLVRGVMKEILLHGRVIRGWIGLVLADVTEEYARQTNMPYYGVLIARLHSASPAFLAGLSQYDKIETLDGQPVRSGPGMMDRIAKIQPGTTVKITGIRARNTQPFSVDLKVIEAPPGSQ